MPEPLLSMVVPCMGRLHHLQLTAPALLAQPDIEYILVDYSCPDRCGAYARTHWPRAKVVEVPGESHFNKPRALNAGSRAATGRWLGHIDADNLVGPDFARVVLSLAADGVLIGHRAPNWGTGFLVCNPRVYTQSGGYDERFDGWGPEDWDMRQRLLGLGLRLRLVPDDLIQVIEHDDEERTRYYPIKDKERSGQQLTARMRFRLPLEYRLPWPDPVTFGVPAPDWVQVWKTVQYAHYVRRLLGNTVRLYPYWHAAEPDREGVPPTDYTELMGQLDGLLAGDGPIELAPDAPPATVARFGHRFDWHFPATPARIRWPGWSAGRRRPIGYCLEGAATAACAAQLAHELAPAAFARETIELSSTWPPQRVVATAAGCDLYVGLDNPITQLCYAVGVPVFLLKDGQAIEELIRWHGDQPGVWCRDLYDFLEKAGRFLGG